MQPAVLWLCVHIPILDQSKKVSAEDPGIGSKEQIDDTELSGMSNRGLKSNTQPPGRAKTKNGEKPTASPDASGNQLNVLSGVQDNVVKTESRASSGIGTKYFKIFSLVTP